MPPKQRKVRKVTIHEPAAATSATPPTGGSSSSALLYGATLRARFSESRKTKYTTTSPLTLEAVKQETSALCEVLTEQCNATLRFLNGFSAPTATSSASSSPATPSEPTSAAAAVAAPLFAQQMAVPNYFHLPLWEILFSLGSAAMNHVTRLLRKHQQDAEVVQTILQGAVLEANDTLLSAALGVASLLRKQFAADGSYGEEQQRTVDSFLFGTQQLCRDIVSRASRHDDDESSNEDGENNLGDSFFDLYEDALVELHAQILDPLCHDLHLTTPLSTVAAAAAMAGRRAGVTSSGVASDAHDNDNDDDDDRDLSSGSDSSARRALGAPPKKRRKEGATRKKEAGADCCSAKWRWGEVQLLEAKSEQEEGAQGKFPDALDQLWKHGYTVPQFHEITATEHAPTTSPFFSTSTSAKETEEILQVANAIHKGFDLALHEMCVATDKTRYAPVHINVPALLPAARGSKPRTTRQVCSTAPVVALHPSVTFVGVQSCDELLSSLRPAEPGPSDSNEVGEKEEKTKPDANWPLDHWWLRDRGKARAECLLGPAALLYDNDRDLWLQSVRNGDSNDDDEKSSLRVFVVRKERS